MKKFGLTDKEVAESKAKYGDNSINKLYHAKYQALCSYKLIFRFTTDAGILSYLNGKEFCIGDTNELWFVKLLRK